MATAWADAFSLFFGFADCGADVLFYLSLLLFTELKTSLVLLEVIPSFAQ